MKVPCLFDTNSFITCYFTLPGYEVVRYIVRKSPSAEIFLSKVQSPEIISLLYKAYREGVISSKEILETYRGTFLKEFQVINKEFVSEHLLDFNIYEKITNTPPPGTKYQCNVDEKIKHAQNCNIGKSLTEKDPCNTGDTILLPQIAMLRW